MEIVKKMSQEETERLKFMMGKEFQSFGSLLKKK